jgi:UDP-N-acetylglucosamine--N-acetylmuramyl-(pentapeptide) pyrophosphoryl-undecaprenol N-acetylglucosamine transferase
VYISVFGSGLGHAVRMIEIARELEKKGKAVVFSSYGEPADFIRRNGFNCFEIPPVDVHYSNSGTLSPNATVISFPILFFSSFLQFSYELSNISRVNPKVVVSDSLPSSVIAGVVLRKPVVTFLNQASIEPSNELPNPVYRAVSVGSYSGLTRVWNRSRKIVIPDLPPPFTISERNIRGLKREKTLFTGFLVKENSEKPDSLALQFVSEKKTKVFWSVSGPPNTRKALVKKALEISKKLSDKYSFAVSAGNPSGSSKPCRVENVIFYEWCDVQDFLIKSCDVVISRAGHMTIGKIIYYGKPALLIPIKNQTEQEGNAEKARKLGFAQVLDQQEISAILVEKMINELLKNSYRDKAIKLSHLSRSVDSWGKSMEAILSYC